MDMLAFLARFVFPEHQLDSIINVIGVVITSSPARIPNANIAKCKAAVPEETTTQYLAPVYLHNSSSKLEICGPQVRKSDLKALKTAQ